MLGVVGKDDDMGWLYSDPLPVRALGNAEVAFILEGYEDDPHPRDHDAAIAAFLSAGPDVLAAAAPHVYDYYLDINGHWDPADDEYLDIPAPDRVWEHVQFGFEAHVQRDDAAGPVYVSLECNCDWEPEHGLQLVFRNGDTVSKVGPYDGHLTNTGAYGDGRGGEAVYRRLGRTR